MTAAVIPMRAPMVRALVRERDALDHDDPKHRERDQRAYEALLWWACEVDIIGLEVWWGNGYGLAGRVLRVEDIPGKGRVLFTETGEDARGADLWEVLAAGWLREPDDPGDVGTDGFLATTRALERREQRGAPP